MIMRVEHCSVSSILPVRASLGSRPSSCWTHRQTFGNCSACRPHRKLRGSLHCSASQDRQQDSQNAPSLLDDSPPSTSTPQGVRAEDSRFPTKWLSLLSFGGVAVTGYLTWAKLFNSPVVCPASGSCENVLSSDYATVFGIPLSLLGLLGYAGVAFLSTAELLRGKPRAGTVTRPVLLTGGAVLASCSSYLLYILATQFPGETCTWCLTSAFLSISLFILAAQGLPTRELGEAAKPASGSAVAVIAALTVAWSGAESPKAMAELDLPYQATPVREDSSDRAVQLARQLKVAGAHMYGAFWCGHCQEQKAMFGKQAQADLPYVECFPNGWRKGVKIESSCKEAGVQGFPSWVIGDKKFEGERTFDQLEASLKDEAKPAS